MPRLCTLVTAVLFAFSFSPAQSARADALDDAIQIKTLAPPPNVAPDRFEPAFPDEDHAESSPPSHQLWNRSGSDTSGGLSFIWSRFKPLGNNPQLVVPGGPTSWEITSYDLLLSANRKRQITGPLYLGWELGVLFGASSEDMSTNPILISESYGRVGLEAHAEFGARIPLGSRMHIDAGLQLGMLAHVGGGDESEFSYTHAILWGGPAILLEPNGRGVGPILGASYRLPIAGVFALDNFTLANPDPSYNLESGSALRFEAGFQFNRGIAIKVFVEFNDYKYDTIGEQDHQTYGIAVTGTF